MNFIRLNTALVIPSHISGFVIELSRYISQKVKTLYILDGINCFPHITLYFPEYSEKNKESVLNVVEEISKKAPKIECVFDTVSSEDGVIVINLKPTEDILKLRDKITDSLNPLREGKIRDKYKKRTEEYELLSDEHKKEVEDYGYPRVHQFPHISIAELKNKEELYKVEDLLHWDINSFDIEKIGVYEMGLHGTCIKLIKEFNLRNK